MASKLYLPPSVRQDPPSLPRAPRAPDVFDHSPHRNRGQQGIALSNREWDNRIIANAVSLGMPRVMAEQARVHPPARFNLVLLWTIVQDANEGDPKAKNALDRIRHAFDHAAEVSESLGATEQENDPRELQSMLGAD